MTFSIPIGSPVALLLLTHDETARAKAEGLSSPGLFPWYVLILERANFTTRVLQVQGCAEMVRCPVPVSKSAKEQLLHSVHSDWYAARSDLLHASLIWW